ncbi:GspE/PulE family protein [Aestuariirhabdus sp. Z084]|uniref:GspE/PulE family protein n=1 Tax=Aestuariirhabdus haliotis TaxID=2918751 RepID=UPI00201B3E7A|nr:GspE/PulE family protein [Aestuariirhabdus haliotis]MCL6414993.1 GspE/PulE family protein [Aestuariirhabdus haliotis]MCL6418925.1 GspE/PulE family protein [Aestuariirhabdus haliotis]
MADQLSAAGKRLRLGDLLVQQKLISNAQLELALQQQKRTGIKLGRTVIDMGFIEEEKLLQVFSQQLKIPFVDLRFFKFDNALIQRLPETHARRYRALILSDNPDGLLVGMADPLDLFAQDELRRILGPTIKLAVVRESEVLQALDSAYRKSGEIASLAGEIEDDLQDGDFDLTQIGLSDNAGDAPVVRLLQTLFEDAIQVHASDIHIEPDESVVRIRQRIDGVLDEQVMKEKRVASALVLRLKVMSGLDISEKRLPQDGRFNIRVKGRNIDVRLSTMPVQHGESVVMRLLDQSEGVFSTDKLGMSEKMLRRFRMLLTRPYGMVLVTGPTGSGKTTSLYAGISELNTPDKKIITVEDPVEYRLPRINQVQVNDQIGLTFSRVLRSALRQDPDIVLVGEIRDHETAEIALRAAMTGHLVLSTLHTNDAMTSALRLIDMGVESFLVASALNAVLAQRLVRRLCNNCKEEEALSPRELKQLQAIAQQVDITHSTFYRGRGCHHCNNSGYRGRVGIYELLEFDSPMIDALRDSNQNAFVAAASAAPDYRPLVLCALDYAMAAVTSVEEVFRVSATLVDESGLGDLTVAGE